MDWIKLLNWFLELIGKGQPELKKIIWTRNTTNENGIFSTVTLDWDSWVGAGLENPAFVIPAGEYSLEWHVSPHLNNATFPMLIGVEGRSEILIHFGNNESCSIGCLLLGLVVDGPSIDSTHTACEQLFKLINDVGIENIRIVIS